MIRGLCYTDKPSPRLLFAHSPLRLASLYLNIARAAQGMVVFQLTGWLRLVRVVVLYPGWRSPTRKGL